MRPPHHVHMCWPHACKSQAYGAEIGPSKWCNHIESEFKLDDLQCNNNQTPATSGWYCKANLRYCFLTSSAEQVYSRPMTWKWSTNGGFFNRPSTKSTSTASVHGQRASLQDGTRDDSKVHPLPLHSLPSSWRHPPQHQLEQPRIHCLTEKRCFARAIGQGPVCFVG
jgi:hypothetical protein